MHCARFGADLVTRLRCTGRLVRFRGRIDKPLTTMFDWLKNRLFPTGREPESGVAGASKNETSGEADLTANSISHKKAGDAYFGQGKFTEAAVCYREAISCNPDFAEALNNLGNACREMGLLEDAERFLRQAAAIKSLPNVHYNLATLMLERGRLPEAIARFDEELQRSPKHYSALSLKLHCMRKICHWDDLDANILTLRQGGAEPYKSAESVCSPFIFITLPGTSPEEQKLCAEKWVRSEYQLLAELRKKLAFSHGRPDNEKIALGYLSGEFRDHSMARLMAEVFEQHNRARFHVTAYSYGPDEDSEMRKRLQSSFDQFVDIKSISDMDAARRIYADHIDILIDLTGYTVNSRSGILALRPAPRQVNYLGYPGTMGADFVDYLIADQFIIPPEHQKHYTEKIVYLPNCYQPNDGKRPRFAAPTRKSVGLPESGHVFCCFNQTYKITPEIFNIWCRLLIAVPGSVLWLSASTPYSEERLRREAERRGVSSERLVMGPMLDPAQHLARLQCADLFLDTVPYNAHTTCSDALWMGLPVVTCAGETFPSRVAGSLLSAMGVPELITYDLEDYFGLARDLATDRTKLDVVRKKIISNRETSPLFDSALYTRNLEEVYSKIMSEIPTGVIT